MSLLQTFLRSNVAIFQDEPLFSFQLNHFSYRPLLPLFIFHFKSLFSLRSLCFFFSFLLSCPQLSPPLSFPCVLTEGLSTHSIITEYNQIRIIVWLNHLCGLIMELRSRIRRSYRKHLINKIISKIINNKRASGHGIESLEVISLRWMYVTFCRSRPQLKRLMMNFVSLIELFVRRFMKSFLSPHPRCLNESFNNQSTALILP